MDSALLVVALALVAASLLSPILSVRILQRYERGVVFRRDVSRAGSGRPDSPSSRHKLLCLFGRLAPEPPDTGTAIAPAGTPPPDPTSAVTPVIPLAGAVLPAGEPEPVGGTNRFAGASGQNLGARRAHGI